MWKLTKYTVLNTAIGTGIIYEILVKNGIKNISPAVDNAIKKYRIFYKNIPEKTDGDEDFDKYGLIAKLHFVCNLLPQKNHSSKLRAIAKLIIYYVENQD